MPARPNILFLMTDQMQGRVLEPGHPCHTPNFDRLAAGGLRIRNAYAPNPVCSPSRASLMTGLLPHNHGVLEVTHCLDEDQGNLRTDKPHWAQALQRAGYRTGYFGKWHVERSEKLTPFGWEVDGGDEGPLYAQRAVELAGNAKPRHAFECKIGVPEGYNSALLYAVTGQPPEQRGMGVCTSLALDFLNTQRGGKDPWCCFVSVTEPHDPYVCGQEAFDRYDAEKLPLPPTSAADLAQAPGLYRKIALYLEVLTDRQKREAAACYYALISEIDSQYGRLLDWLDANGQAENTIVVLTSDHGDQLGAHGLWFKNVGAYEETYNIPMVLRGPGIAQGVTNARVGLHEVGGSLLELAGLEAPRAPDGRPFTPLLRDPANQAANFRTGYAEYYGNRLRLTQRVVWDGPWKFVFNGFDMDELYNLDKDPFERANRIADPACRDVLRGLTQQLWRTIRDTGDHALWNSQYPVLRAAPYGPGIL